MKPPDMKMTPQGVPDWWYYEGPGDGKNGLHKLVQFSQHECITWSSLSSATSGGWSWIGDWNEFRKQFVPAPSP